MLVCTPGRRACERRTGGSGAAVGRLQHTGGILGPGAVQRGGPQAAALGLGTGASLDGATASALLAALANGSAPCAAIACASVALGCMNRQTYALQHFFRRVLHGKPTASISVLHALLLQGQRCRGPAAGAARRASGGRGVCAERGTGGAGARLLSAAAACGCAGGDPRCPPAQAACWRRATSATGCTVCRRGVLEVEGFRVLECCLGSVRPALRFLLAGRHAREETFWHMQRLPTLATHPKHVNRRPALHVCCQKQESSHGLLSLPVRSRSEIFFSGGARRLGGPGAWQCCVWGRGRNPGRQGGARHWLAFI